MSQPSNIYDLSAKLIAAVHRPDDAGDQLPKLLDGSSVGRPAGLHSRSCGRAGGPAAPGWVVDHIPPGGNTGGELTPGASVKLDWLNTVHPTARLANVRSFISIYLGEPEDQEYGRHTYQKSCRWATGAELHWSEGRQECWLTINGDSLDMIPLAGLRSVIRTLVEDLAGKGRRVDLALDDYRRRVSLDEIHAAADAGNFTGYKTTECVRQLKNRQLTGDSRSFGKRGKDGSGRFFQVYDKKLESGGEIDSIRYELRVFKETAELYLASLAASITDESFARKIGEFIGGAIDFKDRSRGGVHLARMIRLGWWQKIIDVVAAAKLIYRKITPPLQKTFEKWIRPAVLPTLALIKVVCESQGQDFENVLLDLIDQAEQRISWEKNGKRDLGLNFTECFG